MRTSLLSALLTPVVLAVAGTAQAATWSQPVTVSAPHTFIAPVALTPGGDAALATWGWQDGTAPGPRDQPFSAAGLPVNGSGASAEHPAPAGLVAAATYGRLRSVALSQTEAGRSGALVRFRVAATFGRTTDGSFGRPHTLALAPTANQPQLGVGGNGLAIATWIEIAGRRRIVRAAIRPAGGAFGRPTTLSGTGQADLVAAASNGRDLAVAFLRNGRLLARVRRPHHNWGSIQELARADRPTKWSLTLAMTVPGRVEAVWRRHRLARPGQPDIRSIEASYMPAGGGRWHRGAQTVEPDGASDPVLLDTPSGFAVGYARDGATPGTAIARVALAHGSPSFGAPLDASAPVGGLRDVRLATGPQGTLASWIEPRPQGDGDGQGMGAFLPVSGSAFQAPEAITPSENVHEVATSVDARANGFVAVWSARPEGTGPGVPVAQIRSVVRTARRMG
jgi:hypothetical protein